MIKEFEFYHGAVLTALIHKSDAVVTFSSFSHLSNAAYVLNGQAGLYIKHSSKRMSPWIFTMQKDHTSEIVKMQKELSEVYVLLVCGEDGVVTLSYDQTFTIISEDAKQAQWISASRSPRSEYAVKGSSGVLTYRIGKNDLFKKVLNL